MHKFWASVLFLTPEAPLNTRSWEFFNMAGRSLYYTLSQTSVKKIYFPSGSWTLHGRLWTDGTGEADKEPMLWLRYVDDTFIVWPHVRVQLVTFLDHLNGLCEKIQFTMEIEEENQLPFLDVLVERNKNTLTKLVFCKKTHTVPLPSTSHKSRQVYIIT